MPTTKRRWERESKHGDQRAQRACSACKRKGITYVCSGCRSDKNGEVFIRGPKSERLCFSHHLKEVHGMEIQELETHIVDPVQLQVVELAIAQG